MIDPIEVCVILREHADLDGMGTNELLPSCRLGLDWVKRHLRDNANENDPLIGRTAAALARYYLFIGRLGESDRFKSYKAGDMTVQRDIEKEYELENRLRQQALIDAAEILRDGGFYFAVN